MTSALDLNIRLLGPVDVLAAGGRLALGGTKPTLVLALLALDVGHVVSVDRLIEAVWGDETNDNAGATLQVYVSKLRRTLASGGLDGRLVLVAQRPGYKLDVNPNWVDLVRFRTLVEAASSAAARGAHDEAIRCYSGALELWRGVALADVADNDVVAVEVRRLESERAEASFGRLSSMVSAHRHVEAIRGIEHELLRAPLWEQLWELLMLAMYRAGRQADALTAFRRARVVLNEELGVDPGPDLRRMEEFVLRQDPSLDVASPARGKSLDVTVRAAPRRAGRNGRLQLPGGRQVLLDGPRVTLGRSPEADITLEDSLASRTHAAIRFAGSSFRITDLNSTNGTRVNDLEISEQELTHGDRITIGDITIVFGEDGR